jgi:hypothetical protein
MKKFALFTILTAMTFILSACPHADEQFIGYNDEGLAIIRVCESLGSPGNSSAIASTCRIELRNYSTSSSAE